MYIIDLLLLNGLKTKKQAKKVLSQGLVTYNNEPIYENKDITTGLLQYQDKVIDLYPLKYYILNKPKGYVCGKDENYKSIYDIIDLPLQIVGRLDQDTTGLVLLTNHSKLRKHILLPENHIEKEYLFRCLKPLSQEDISLIEEGIIIDKNIKLLPAKIRMINNFTGYITITDGKYHEIKKIFLSMNNQIIKLHRIRIANILLKDLKEGEYRALTVAEIEALKTYV